MSGQKIRRPLSVCVCGGGNLAHVLAGVMGSNPAVDVRVLTRRPADWASVVKVYWEENVTVGRISAVSANAAEVVPGSDVVLLALPAFARRPLLEQVRPHAAPSSWIGSMPGAEGFGWVANEVLGPKAKIFGTDRSPYTCRIVEYGRSVRISGTRPSVALGALPLRKAAEIAATLETLLGIRMDLAPNYLAIMLTNANAILHPTRLYSLFKDWKKGKSYPRKFLFYRKWNALTTKLYLSCDREIQTLIRKLPLDCSSIRPIMERYGATTPNEITALIRTSPTLSAIGAPLVCHEDGYEPNFEHRFFTEDISHGLVSLRAVAEMADCPTPTIDEILSWAQEHLGRKFIDGKKLVRAGNRDLPIPSNFGIKNIDELVRRAVY